MASKWKKRAKKILKSVAKGAGIIGGGMLAAKAFGGRKPRGGFLKSGAAGGASLRPPMPSHLGEGVARPYQDDIMRGGTGTKLAPEGRSWRSYLPFKKGGSAKKAKVTGAAKRGFGRALMKVKK